MINKTRDSFPLLEQFVLISSPESETQVEIKQLSSEYNNMLIFQVSERGVWPSKATRMSRMVWIQWMHTNKNPTEEQIQRLDTLSDNPHNEVFLIRPEQREIAINMLHLLDPYLGVERWTRQNHYGLIDNKPEISKIGNRLKKIWHGQCPHCRVTLKEMPGWAGSECPQCGRHFS